MAITSFLSSVGSGNLGNVLQALGGAPTQVADVPVTATRPVPQGAPGGMAATPSPVQQTLARLPEREAPRRSMLQRIGGLADALAVAGDAKPLYQPTLDARDARVNQAQALEQQRLGTVMQGYQAMLDNGVDPVQARTMLPQLMQQVNMSPEFANQVLSTVEQNPDALQGMLGLAGAARDPAKHGMNVQYATDGQGNVMAYTVNDRGQISRLQMPEGFTPTMPVQAVQAGDRTVLANRLTGAPVGSPVTHGVDPDVAANNEVKVSEGEADRANRRAIVQAQIEARREAAEAKAGANAPNRQAIANAARPIVAGLKDAVTRLRNSGGMTDTSSSALDVIGAEARERLPFLERVTSPEGFKAREDINQMVRSGMTTLVPLVGGMTLGSRNLDAGKELEFWANSILSARSYESAMRALEGYERTIEEIEAELAPSQPAPSRRNPPPARRSSNIRATPRATSAPSAPTVSNW